MNIDIVKEEQAARLRGSLQEFIKFFTKYMTQRDYIESKPIGRESHQISICRELTQMTRMEHPEENLLINVEPGSGKSLHLCMWVAWCFTHYPDCNFIYISFSHTLASSQTSFIKMIMQSDMYRYLFDVELSKESRAKDHFATTAGGNVAAFGSAGAITGRNAGLPGLDRFSGAVIIDDAHKPDEAHSDTVRESVIRNYEETIRQRPRGHNVPIIFVGQRVHEADLASFFMEDKDTKPWRKIILKSLDEAGNALYPEVHNKEFLLELEKKSPYVFASQFQQDPLPAGGGLFKSGWVVETDMYPEILATFITADTAETSKSYNDATAFSFWGIYEIESLGRKTGIMGLHWLDCVEMRIEPKDLKDAFLDFWQECNRFDIAPHIAAIEKKSTGVTLLSALSEIRGINVKDIKRTRASGSKTERFLRIQPYLANKQISINTDAKHKKMCLDHLLKITANDTHRHDDICFAENTMIATPWGDRKIQHIKKGDKVLTPFGVGLVSEAGLTGKYETINKFSLKATRNHPVFCENSFAPIDTLADDAKISHLTLNEMIKWRYKKLLTSMGLRIDSWGRNAIILASRRAIKEGSVLKDCMWRFGNFITNKQYQKAMWFIIKTITHLITIFLIWNVYLGGNILKTTGKIVSDGIKAMKARSISSMCKSKLRNGINQLMGAVGIKSMLKQVCCARTRSSAAYAQRCLKESNGQNIVQKNAITTKKPKERVEKEQKKNVYNLKVERYGVYFANGILVSNCDTLADAVDIALIEKQINVETSTTNDDAKMAALRQGMLRRVNARSQHHGGYR